jgi:hypothetical protein
VARAVVHPAVARRIPARLVQSRLPARVAASHRHLLRGPTHDAAAPAPGAGRQRCRPADTINLRKTRLREGEHDEFEPAA